MVGTSLMPKIGNHTQNIPPTTSVNDNKVNSAAGKFFEPIEYKIKPTQTRDPCKAKSNSFLLEERKETFELKIIVPATKEHIIPATDTVVNFGVSFLHLKLTEKIANPKADNKPNPNPVKVPILVLLRAIITIPIAASIIENHVLIEIFSFKKIKPSSAAMNGIAANINRVTAAVVVVIDQIKLIIAHASPAPPSIPENPILK